MEKREIEKLIENKIAEYDEYIYNKVTSPIAKISGMGLGIGIGLVLAMILHLLEIL